METAVNELKKAMGYVSESQCCACCENYRSATGGFICGGGLTESRGERCSLNVIEVPISAGGRCDHFNKKEPLANFNQSNKS